MCEALNDVDEKEWSHLVDKVDAIDRTVAEWKGAVKTMRLFMGSVVAILMLLLGSVITLSISLVGKLNAHDTTLALQSKDFTHFSGAGPRFTASNYDTLTRAATLEMREWVLAAIDHRKPQPAEAKALNLIEQHLEALDRRLDAIDGRP